MKISTIAGAILIVLGLQGIFYGGFNYAVQNSKTGKEASTLAAHQKQRVTVPLCVGAVGFLAGGLMLFVGLRKRGPRKD